MNITLLLSPSLPQLSSSKKSRVAEASRPSVADRKDSTAFPSYTQPPSSAAPFFSTTCIPPSSDVTKAPTFAPLIPTPTLDGPGPPAVEELCPRQDLALRPHTSPLRFGPLGPTTQQHLSSDENKPSPSVLKRPASPTPLPENPAKKQSKWTLIEDELVIELRGQGMKWDNIAERLQGRSSTSCRLRYQNYLEKGLVWDEEKKTFFAYHYDRFKEQMWQKVAKVMGVPWRSAESMHWQLGQQEMSDRANQLVFQLHSSATDSNRSSPSRAPVHTAPATHGDFIPADTTQTTLHPLPVASQHPPPATPIPQTPRPRPKNQYRSTPAARDQQTT